MVFSSMVFLFYFLPALLIVYYLIPKRLREVRNIVLLLFSLVFYAYAGPWFVLLIAITSAINYFCGLFAAPDKPLKIRKLAVFAAVALGLGILGWYKYSGFIAENINRLGAILPVPKVVLPVGISFYTFQGISYVLDVYRGDVAPQRNPLRIALYISLFPQLAAGPIVRYATIEQELQTDRESFEAFSTGAMRFVFGLAKKMLLANALGEITDKLFIQTPGTLSVLAAWVGAMAYTGQIYFDFSAYSDMAIGLGKMFGFHFLENFNYPYISKSITEFWRRWHISLSSWFRDYLYIPLGGNRVNKARHIRNIIVVWLLTGLWHGAAWNFVMWGAWFCLLLLGEKYIWGELLDRTPSALGHIYTMVLVIISWVLFRSDTLSYATRYIGAMFGSSGVLYDGRGVYYIVQYWPEILFAVIAALPVKDFFARLLKKRRGVAAETLYAWGSAALALLLLAMSYIRLITGSFNPFIYFRF